MVQIVPALRTELMIDAITCKSKVFTEVDLKNTKHNGPLVFKVKEIMAIALEVLFEIVMTTFSA